MKRSLFFSYFAQSRFLEKSYVFGFLSSNYVLFSSSVISIRYCNSLLFAFVLNYYFVIYFLSNHALNKIVSHEGTKKKQTKAILFSFMASFFFSHILSASIFCYMFLPTMCIPLNHVFQFLLLFFTCEVGKVEQQRVSKNRHITVPMYSPTKHFLLIVIIIIITFYYKSLLAAIANYYY